MWPIGTTVPLVSDRSTLFFFLHKVVKSQVYPSFIGAKRPKCSCVKIGFCILPSLKKFCPRNLEYSTSIKPTNRDTPQWNLHFFRHFVIGAAMLLKFMMNLQ